MLLFADKGQTMTTNQTSSRMSSDKVNTYICNCCTNAEIDHTETACCSEQNCNVLVDINNPVTSMCESCYTVHMEY